MEIVECGLGDSKFFILGWVLIWRKLSTLLRNSFVQEVTEALVKLERAPHSFCFSPALPANALAITKQFTPTALRLLRKEADDAKISGIFVVSNELLLLADCNNNAVKELHVPTGRVELIYTEHEDGWSVCNVRAMRDAKGDFLVLLERKEFPVSGVLVLLPPYVRPHQTRLSVVQKRAVNYCDATHFALENKYYYVCSFLALHLLPVDSLTWARPALAESHSSQPSISISI